MKFDNLEYRKTLGKFVTGVTIITTCEKDGTPRGFTANSFTSVSLEPPLILICIGDFNEGLELFKNSEYFAVNILNEAQVDISNLFAQPVKISLKRLSGQIVNLEFLLSREHWLGLNVKILIKYDLGII